MITVSVISIPVRTSALCNSGIIFQLINCAVLFILSQKHTRDKNMFNNDVIENKTLDVPTTDPTWCF